MFPLQNLYDGTRYVIRGEEVRNWQRFLNATKKPEWPAIKEDGIFGPKTEAATMRATGVNLVTRGDYERLVTPWLDRQGSGPPMPVPGARPKVPWRRILGVGIAVAGIVLLLQIEPSEKK